jgi:hypothetical protein
MTILLLVDWRNIAISLTDPGGGVLSVTACLQQLAWITTVRKFNCSQGSNYV